MTRVGAAMKLGFATSALFVSATLSCQATPVTYACKLLDGLGQAGMYGDVDQVVIDTEAKLVELRVARTMGTLSPVNWIFTNRSGYDGSLEEISMRTAANGALIASGSDGAGSFSFKLEDGYLMFGATYLVPAVAFTWQCH